MNIDLHIPDQVLAQLATLIAERLSEYGDLKLGAYLAAPEAEAEVKSTPAEVQEVETKPTPAPAPAVELTLDEVRTKLAALPRETARQALTDLGFAKLSDVPADQYPRLLELAA